MLTVVAAVIGVVVGAVGAAGLLTGRSRTRLRAAEDERKRILGDAEREAEAVRREAQVDAREQSVQLRSQIEAEVQDRRVQIVKVEERVLQKEEEIGQKLTELIRREQGLGDREVHIKGRRSSGPRCVPVAGEGRDRQASPRVTGTGVGGRPPTVRERWVRMCEPGHCGASDAPMSSTTGPPRLATDARPRNAPRAVPSGGPGGRCRGLRNSAAAATPPICPGTAARRARSTSSPRTTASCPIARPRPGRDGPAPRHQRRPRGPRGGHRRRGGPGRLGGGRSAPRPGAPPGPTPVVTVPPDVAGHPDRRPVGRAGRPRLDGPGGDAGR